MLVQFPRPPLVQPAAEAPAGPPAAVHRRGAGQHQPRRPLDLVRSGVISPAQALAEMGSEGAVAELETGGLERELRVKRALAELDELVGLARPKEVVREIKAFVAVAARRRAFGLAAEPLVLHMVFRGNPGTGKTTVARVLGRVFAAMGVLSGGQLVEVERADLVGEYIGHTAQKTREKLKKAEGGILFIDEAYALARGGNKDFGKEAIDTLVKAMEDMKDRLVLILAGYQLEMARFLDANPGLRSRFPIHLEFPDFSVDELMEIADRMLAKREYAFGPGARDRLVALLRAETTAGGRNAGNARLVRNTIEAAIRRQAVRVVDAADLSRAAVTTIAPADLRL